MNNKQKHLIKRISIILSILLIAFGTVQLIQKVNAYTVSKHDNGDEKTTLYKANSSVIIDEGTFRNLVKNDPYGALANYGSVYCMKHGKALFTHGETFTYNNSTPCYNPSNSCSSQVRSSYYMQDEIILNSRYDSPVFKSGGNTKVYPNDHMDKYDPVADFNTRSNIVYEVSRVDRLNGYEYTPTVVEKGKIVTEGTIVSNGGGVVTDFGTTTGSLLPYVATFNDLYNSETGSGYDTYHNDSQFAIWEKTGTMHPGQYAEIELYKAGKACEAFENQVEKHKMAPKVTPISDNARSCGTTLEIRNNRKYFKVGPFKMSDYAYASSKYAEKYSGKELQYRKDMLGGLTHGEVVLQDDKGDSKVISLDDINSNDVMFDYITLGDNTRSEQGKINQRFIDKYGNTLDIKYEDIGNNRLETTLNGEVINLTLKADNTYEIYFVTTGTTITATLVQSNDETALWGPPANYNLPFPESKFYLLLSEDIVGTFTEVKEFGFEYRSTRADGSGWIANGKFARTKFTKEVSEGCKTYTPYPASEKQCEGVVEFPVRENGYQSNETETFRYSYNKYCYNSGKENSCQLASCTEHNIHKCKGDHKEKIPGTKTTYHFNRKPTLVTTLENAGCKNYKLLPVETNPTTGPLPRKAICQGHTVRDDKEIEVSKPGCRCGCPRPHTRRWSTTCTYTCKYHDYRHCKHVNWKASVHGEIPQPLLGIQDAYVEVREIKIKEEINVRLTTDLTINKYISKAEHVIPSNNDYKIEKDTIVFDGNPTRSRLNEKYVSIDQKRKDPLKVERGDRVTFNIDILNAQKQAVKCQILDILPPKDTIDTVTVNGGNIRYGYGVNAEDNSNISENEISFVQKDFYDVTVPGGTKDNPGKTTIVVTLRPIKDSGKYGNFAKITTSNKGTQGYNKATYGNAGDFRENGPVVNIAEDDPIYGNFKYHTSQFKNQKDADFYQIKEYSINIDKYIYDVEHNPETADRGGPNIDTTYKASDDRNHKMISEADKEKFPEYVEYGDIITYRITVYNTTSKYDDSIDNAADPFYSPDKVYVNFVDKLPDNLELLRFEGGGIGVYFENCAGTGSEVAYAFDASPYIVINNLMVPANGKRTVTIKAVVKDKKMGNKSFNEAKLEAEIKNVNRGPQLNSSVDLDHCQIKNNPLQDVSRDWHALNNYNLTVDKFISKYDEAGQKQSNFAELTQDGLVSDENGNLLVSRENSFDKKYKENKDGIVEDSITEFKTNEEYKFNHPVAVEKDDKITYTIKIKNDATLVDRQNNGYGNKPATQIKPYIIVERMSKGITPIKATAVHYTENGQPCDRTYKGDENKNGVGQFELDITNGEGVSFKNGEKGDLYLFFTKDGLILNPNEYLLLNIECTIDRNNLSLDKLLNEAEVTIMENINSTGKVSRYVETENIAQEKIARDYIKMKDLVISGHVWVDFNRNGIMDEGEISQDKQDLYNVNNHGFKKDVKVELYRIDPNNKTELIKTTLTDDKGLFTFSRDENLNYYNTNKYFEDYDPVGKVYQRVDKANNKDAYGNYTKDSELYRYYIEYEYDGLIYKSTEFYAGRDNVNKDGSINADYFIDSNAAEFKDKRDEFNRKYEYISYNSAYDQDLNKTGDLKFRKELNGEEAHKSELIEDKSRAMKSRSFILRDANSYDDPNTEYLWLAKLDEFTKYNEYSLPKVKYTRDINLGLELREDVDVALTKDVYDVKTIIDGEEMNYLMNENSEINGNGLKDYIIDKPYGLELYEADYKYRVDQYKANAVRVYKGLRGESELNVKVTHKIRIDNVKTNDDDEVAGSGNEELNVRINEILDLYDENYIPIEFDNLGKMDKSKGKNEIPIKIKNADGTLRDETLKTAEVWYYKEDPTGDYIIGNIADIGSEGNKNPVYVQYSKDELKDYPRQRYSRVDLEFAKDSSRGDKGKFSEKENEFTEDGYNTIYIRGIDQEVIKEGDSLEIFTSHVLNKDSMKIYVDKQAYEETKTSTTKVENNIIDNNITIQVNEEVTTENNEYEGSITRALKIIDRLTKSEETRRGLENIAQVNAYSVYYLNDKGEYVPAGLIDKDSNAGNIGVKDTQGNMTDCDDVKFYEDTIYKTGIVMAADGTEQSREVANKKYGEIFINIEAQGNKDILPDRKISGMVWDDSRSAIVEDSTTSKDATPIQYTGNGEFNSGDTVKSEAQMNDNVRVNYKLDGKEVTEAKDIVVRNAKAEFVEIVKIPEDEVKALDEDKNKLQNVGILGDENKTNINNEPKSNSLAYYEEVLTDVTWPQVRHSRTDNTGKYTLRGMVPGDYIVRFTYGDTVEENKDKKPEEYSKEIEAQKDMLVFNGQDYKSTKYNKNHDEEEKDADKILLELQEPRVSDARDDEIRRLEVNAFSEIMTNDKAELIKGIANGSEGILGDNGEVAKLTAEATPNSSEMLKKFTDSTYMNSETVEFMVKPEKLDTDEKTTHYLKIQKSWITGKPIKDIELTDEEKANLIYYKNLDKLNFADKETRKFEINNIDLGITYRPESQINLIKTIKEVGLTTQDGKELIKLVFDTDENMVRRIDMEKSKGMEVVQFIPNTYKGIYTDLFNEQIQGFIYLQVDDQLLQGAKVSIKYDFDAVNNSEIDRISKKLNDIRYKENDKAKELKEFFDDDYTASGTARNVIYNEIYNYDDNHDLYRNREKKVNLKNKDKGYYGLYVAESYYTNVTDTTKEVVSPLKFDKILDYVDVDLEFENETSREKLINKLWNKKQSVELRPYLSIFKDARGASNGGTTNLDILNPEKIKYNTLVVSVDDRISDSQPDNEIINKGLSKFLQPMKENVEKSKGHISLELSKVLAQENDTKNMSYENLAEIIQFTTLTGRRTNFATTIGNANLSNIKNEELKNGSAEFVNSMYETDTAATETVTFTPPTGLMKNRRVILDTVETAKTGISYTLIISSIVIVTLIVIQVIKVMIKKKRYK